MCADAYHDAMALATISEIMNTLLLTYQPPYDWAWMLSFLRARAVHGLELCAENHYSRIVTSGNAQGLITIAHRPDENALQVTLSDELAGEETALGARIARFLDLSLNPQAMLETLGPLAAARPGLRLPGCIDGWEQAIRAVLGQLVSVAMAARLTARLVEAWGEPLSGFPGMRLFPAPGRLAELEPEALKALGMPLMRARAIIHLARLHLQGAFPLQAPQDIDAGLKQLMALPGIGRWTACYYALRGWQAPDMFLADDYLVKQRFAGMTPAQTRGYASRWQPWRSYALLHIWNTDGWRPECEAV